MYRSNSLIRKGRNDNHLPMFQGSVDWAFVGNLQQTSSVSICQVHTLDEDLAFDSVKEWTLSLFCFPTFFAILFVDLIVGQCDGYSHQWKLLSIGIHAQCHDGTRSQGR